MASRPSIPNWRCASLADLLHELKRRLPEIKEGEQDDLLLALLQDAASLICNYTWQPSVPAALQSVQVRIAVMLYNRLGAEGEKSRTEGDIARTFDLLPQDVLREMQSHRLARTGNAL